MADPIFDSIKRLRVKKDLLEVQYDEVHRLVRANEAKLIDLDIARTVIQLSAKRTQEQLSFHITGIVTLALDAVWPDKYKFKLDFVERRNKVEADVLITQDGHDFDPMTDNGGSVVDVLSFALRVALWSLGKTAPVMFLDEPFRFLSSAGRTLMANVVKELSDKLDLQFIIVSHDAELFQVADNTVHVQQADGVSHVEYDT